MVVVATLLAIVASVGAVMLLSRALSRPIGRLTEGAAAIGGGQLGHRIPVEGRDELALLSGHFNRMAEQLEEQRRALLEQQALLERKVGERTAQLEEANRRLKDLDRLRVLFLADVSHELRTPLDGAARRGRGDAAQPRRPAGGLPRDAGGRSSSRPSRWAGWSTTCCSSPGPRPTRSASSSRRVRSAGRVRRGHRRRAACSPAPTGNELVGRPAGRAAASSRATGSG